jgi:hypothetical protein
MPDVPVEPVGPARYPGDMETRVAVLEQVARDTTRALEWIERRLDMVAIDQRSDFRWLLGMILGTTSAMLGVMAHGFHWL